MACRDQSDIDLCCEISNVGFFDGAEKRHVIDLLFNNSEIYSRNVG